MQKAGIAAVLLVLLFAFGAYSGPLSGTWDTDLGITVHPDGSVAIPFIESSLLASYELDNWILSALTRFRAGRAARPVRFGPWLPINGHALLFGGDGLTDITFYADGTLGAYTLGGLTVFDAAEGGSLLRAQGFATLAISGAELYGFVALENQRHMNTVTSLTGSVRNGEEGISVGALFGAYGWASVCWLGAEVSLGLEGYSSLWDVFYGLAHGIPTTLHSIWQHNEACQGTLLYPHNPCQLAFSYASFYALFPFGCLDLYSALHFSCTNGFSVADFSLLDIDLGIPWIELAELNVVFWTYAKSVRLDFDLNVADTVCITPYLSVISADQVTVDALPKDVDSQYTIQGISLDGLLLEYSVNGVTLIVSELFSTIVPGPAYYLTETGRLCGFRDYPGCCSEPAPWIATEAIGLEIDGDSCCGAQFNAGFYSFFLPGDSSGIFDWVGTTATIEYGLSQQVVLDAHVSVGLGGLEWLGFGFEFTWGTPPDYGECCIRRRIAI